MPGKNIDREDLIKLARSFNEKLDLVPSIDLTLNDLKLERAIKTASQVLIRADRQLFDEEEISIMSELDISIPTDDQILESINQEQSDEPTGQEIVDSLKVLPPDESETRQSEKNVVTKVAEMQVPPINETSDVDEGDYEKMKSEFEKYMLQSRIRSDYIRAVGKMIAEGKYTKKEIMDEVLRRYKVKKRLLSQVLNSSKSPKYSRFKPFYAVEIDGILYITKAND